MKTMEKAPLIFEKMAAIMADATPIAKDQRNKDQGYTFRGIDDVYNTLHSIFSKHKVFLVPEVLESSREERKTKSNSLLIYTIQRVKFTFYAVDGSSVSAIVEGEGMDTSDKSTNKSSSGALKYALLQIFLIPTAEMKTGDADASTPQPMSKAEEIAQLIADAPNTMQVLNLIATNFNVIGKDNELFGSALLTGIALVQTEEDLKALKSSFPNPFNMEGPVKKAAIEKYKEITKSNQDATA
ncbi:ERF family protein [Chitinophaga sp. Hz27]|uniref:ERF family protein n=1 Tax=Chitinophaga sp. Hz27 TaxID=3347169 RepID=UPI0035D9DAFB